MNDLITIRTELENEINPIVAAAQTHMVVDAESYRQAMELGMICSARIKLVENKLGPSKKKSYEAYQEILKLMKSLIDPPEAAKKILSGRAYAWQRSEEERKRKKAEEARRQAEEEAFQKRVIEEEARLAAAERLANNGMQEQAEEMLAAPIEIEVAEVAPVAPKVKVEGASTRENWRGKVIDENLIPRIYMMPDLVKLNQVTKSLKGETRIPGWEVWDAGTVSFRS